MLPKKEDLDHEVFPQKKIVPLVFHILRLQFHQRIKNICDFNIQN